MALGLIGSLLLADPTAAQDSTKADSPLDDKLEAGEAESSESRRQLVRWNEFEGPFFTIRLGAGFLYEGAAYSQDDASQEQFDLEPDTTVRDARFLLRGRFKTKRPVTWSAGIMYDGATDDWLFRETGVLVAVPELWGHFFIGRTKEGFSLNKVMSGYAGWTMERATMSDATIPILGDGVKWLGYVPHRHLIWNLGFFFDSFNARQAFSTYDNQIVARVAWLPILSEDDRTLLHIGANGRYGAVDEDELQIRSRPEANPAPYFVDTGTFAAQHTAMVGWEAYYRSGPWLFGNEYWVQKADAGAAGDPMFHGGDVAATWILTGETRAYNTVGGFFKAVSPARTLFEGGPGSLEAVLRFSYIDLDAGTLRGGKFWRLTPMINWHVSDNVRLGLTYGYGTLDRFDRRGGTHFFQSRLQLSL